MAARSVALVRHSIIDFAILLIRCIVHSAIAMASTGAKLIRTVIKTSKAPVPLGPYRLDGDLFLDSLMAIPIPEYDVCDSVSFQFAGS